MLDWILSQKHTSFVYSWSTNEECKILEAAVPDQLLAANADAVFIYLLYLTYLTYLFTLFYFIYFI